MTERIDPLDGVFKLLETFSNPSKLNTCREDVFRDEITDHIVDTCVGYDTGLWETGVIERKDDHTTVVEQYQSREEAVIGHAKWLESLINNPTQELKEIFVWDIQ